MGCFVVAEFLLTSASRGPSAIAEPLVVVLCDHNPPTLGQTDRRTDGRTDVVLVEAEKVCSLGFWNLLLGCHEDAVDKDDKHDKNTETSCTS